MPDQKLRAALDTIPGLVWLAEIDGSVEFVNRRWLQYTGLSQAEAVEWGWTQAIHPDDVSALSETWQRVRKSGVRGEADARLGRFDGEYRWFTFTAEPLHDEAGIILGWCGTCIDAHEQRQARDALEDTARALRASEHEMTQIIETMPAFVWRAETDGRLTYVNSRLFAYIGVPAENLWGDGWLNAVHPDDRQIAIDTWLHSVATAEPLHNQYRLRRADGTYRWFYVPGQLGRTADGQPTSWCGLLIDIEDQRSAEHALRRTEMQLARAAQVATVGELAASIAHEVNQPLTAIVTNAHACLHWLLADPPDLLMAREAVDLIARDGKDAGEIVHRVRALFKRADPNRTRVNLNDVIEDVLSLLRGEASRRRVTFNRKLAQDLPDVLGDRVQLQQLVFNLVVNAFDAMDIVTDHPKRLTALSKRADADQIVVEIRDTGIGLSDPERAFESFYTTKPNGMGMGLSICRSIVSAHDGVLWFAQPNERGTTACFSLPVEPNGNQ